MPQADLEQLRQRIDALDEQIQALINERASCAQQVGKVKQKANDPVFYKPDREALVLRRVRERNQGPLSDTTMARLFREIMSACLALERPLRVAYLGPAGTFTQAAALKHFGDGVELTALATIAEVFREVEADGADYGVVPVENSTEGVINHTLDMFLRSPLSISGDVELPIHHQLMGKQNDIAEIKKVITHQQSLAQCREWLDANLPQAERIAVSSNAEAARIVADDLQSAAIASDAVSGMYGLEVLARNIEDDPNNTTRFLIVGKQTVERTGQDKTSLMISAHNQAGMLYKLLEPLARHGVSMTRIESRPSRLSKWDYVFFVDLEGHISDDNITAALKELEESTVQVKVLGSYPRSEL